MILTAVPNLIDAIKNTPTYLLSAFNKIIKWKEYKKNYLYIIADSKQIEIFNFYNYQVIEKKIFDYSDQHFIKYFTALPAIPTYISLQKQIHTFATIATKKLSFQDKRTLIKQSKKRAEQEEKLLTTYKLLNNKNSQVIIEISYSEKIKKLFNDLKITSHPIAAIQSFELEKSLKMQAAAAEYNKLSQLIFCITNHADKSTSITVMCDDKFLIQRYVYTKEYKSLLNEIDETLNFLSRSGYKKDQSIAIILPDSLFKNIKTSKPNIKFFRVDDKIVEREHFYPTNKLTLKFIPKILKENYFAYTLPKFCIKYLTALSMLLFAAGLTAQILSIQEKTSSEYNLIKLKELKEKLPKDSAKIIESSKLFKDYVYINKNNPYKKVKKIYHLLKGKALVEQISWKSAETSLNKQFEIQLKFSTNIQEDILKLQKILATKAISSSGMQPKLINNNNNITIALCGKNAA